MHHTKTHSSSKKRYLFLIFLICFLLFLAAGFSEKLQTSYYTYTNSKIPPAFDGYRIIHISDLHSARFGKKQSVLIRAIEKEAPDLIVFTGDTIDGKRCNLNNVENLLKGISSIAPIYAVTGNHDHDNAEDYDKLQMLYETYHVTELTNEQITLTKDAQNMYLYGLEWGPCTYWHLPKADTSRFNILLFHCTDYFDLIAPYNYDLFLAGHTHGGIIRLPFVGGLLGNSQNFFPKYDSGMFHSGNCTMISSRGLGKADVPRFFNRPDLVCITLKSE